MSNTEREASPSRDRESVTRNERDVTTPNSSDARCSELFVQFPRARMAGGGLKGTLADQAREELEEQERDRRQGVPRNEAPGTRGGGMAWVVAVGRGHGRGCCGGVVMVIPPPPDLMSVTALRLMLAGLWLNGSFYQMAVCLAAGKSTK